MDKGKGSSRRQVTTSAPRGVTTTSTYAKSSNAQSYQMTSKFSDVDRATGSYERYTAKQEVSSGELYWGRGSSQYGVKDEVKTSATYKVGDKSGYTEYYREERIRNVSYENNNRNSYNYGATNNYSSYGGGGSDNYGYVGGIYYESDSD